MQGSSQVVVRSTVYLVVEDKLQHYEAPSKMSAYQLNTHPLSTLNPYCIPPLILLLQTPNLMCSRKGQN